MSSVVVLNSVCMFIYLLSPAVFCLPVHTDKGLEGPQEAEKHRCVFSCTPNVLRDGES